MNWFQTEKEEVIDELESSHKGISDEEAVKRKPSTDPILIIQILKSGVH
jgi:hypothetical protein